MNFELVDTGPKEMTVRARCEALSVSEQGYYAYCVRRAMPYPKRFPADFMFRLSASEWESLRSQTGTLDAGRGRHRKYAPYVFTEQGVDRRRHRRYEVYQLLACTSVPLARRQLYAVVAYTYCRPGELAGATFADIDLDLGGIYVRRAMNWDTRETKKPKTRSGRRIVPIHPNLAPLLQAMRQDENTPLWPALSPWNSDRAGMTFREDLREAGIQREDLYTGNEETTPADLRSLRTTGATFAAISGIQGKTLERRIGHGGGATVDRYVGIAEDITKGAIGEPFGPLPASLVRETLEAFSVIVSVTKNEEPRLHAWIPGVSRSGEGGIRMRQSMTPNAISRRNVHHRTWRSISLQRMNTRGTPPGHLQGHQDRRPSRVRWPVL
jgi:integrase